ncbi:MAG: formate--tetrahydrofolate ligase, partial [Bryobacteraceae bacterium]|nr:formate--tetrahydrofolate ligase [Bryobacteraceae bacterium]
LSIPEEFLHSYGKHTAKLDLDVLESAAGKSQGKLVLVTAMTPTRAGEGKTVNTIGLTQAFWRLGQKAVAALREPSLGPVFGLKGGASGGGLSQVLPAERINLHFNGDNHAVTAAHNLLAAMIDSALHFGNTQRLDVDNIHWPRAMDMNDRALRQVITGLGGKANGVPRETGFVITAASEVMAILGLAGSRRDLRQRLEAIVVGLDTDGRPVRARDMHAAGAMLVLLNEAIMPNLVQTTEHAPALIHTGPFANVAHGTASVLAQRMGLALADWVVNETGFGADLGAEKYMHIVMPESGLRPSAAVVVVSARAVAEQGIDNVERHVRNLKKFGLPVVVAVNRFPTDGRRELDLILHRALDLEVTAVEADAYSRGGEGAVELARAVMQAAETPSNPRPLYDASDSLESKIETIARELYGAGAVHLESGARAKLRRFQELGFGELPVCMAKTQYSFSDDPKRKGAPTGFTLTVTDAHLAAGAGYVVVIAGNMLRMPGLGREPQAIYMDVDDKGRIFGMP